MKTANLFKTTALVLTGGLLFAGCGSAAVSGSASTSAQMAGSSESTGTETASASESTETAAANASGSTGEVTTITAATGGSPKPYVYVDENNEPTGYDIEVLKEVFDRLPQYDLQIEVTDFSSIFTGLTADKYQIGVNSFTYNEERAQSYLYSFPYDLNAYVFIQKKDASPITSFADAAGKTIESGSGGAITTGLEKWNEEHPDQQINLQYTEADTTTILQHVEDGVTDFAIMDPAMFKVYTEDFNMDDLRADDLDEDSTAFISTNLNSYFLLPQDQTQLRDDIDAVIKELHDDGTLAELTSKWFGRELVPDDDQYEKTIN